LTNPPSPLDRRAILCEQLHGTYEPHCFDNWLVWAGQMAVRVDGSWCDPTLARVYVGPSEPALPARIRVELFVAAVDAAQVRSGEVVARLWTDVNRRGQVDADGVYRNDPGYYLPMHLVCGADGTAQRAGDNLVFESADFSLCATGVFSFTTEFSAASRDPADRRKEWISLNDIAPNKDGVLVVSPAWLREGPSTIEVCVRKVGARHQNGRFHSGTFAHLQREVEQLPADILYLLPFFKPGFFDLYSGADVRKGSLGSVYAIADFFQLDPALVSAPEEVDLEALLREDLLRDDDLEALLGEQECQQLGGARGLACLPVEKAVERIGRDPLVQLIGRSELRALTRRAHRAGKRVIFDLVLMQTSRDNPLIHAHPEWYVLDEKGRPRTHSIAWLVYSDVALFGLQFNKSLQNYLLGVAPYWIEACDLDGVRIDASQTVDRPFLKQLKNSINAVRPDALVLGETLCPLDEAADIPVDVVYALLVDYHRHLEHAAPLIHFLEEMHQRLPPRTLALAYFENHDSPRATRVWREEHAVLLQRDLTAARFWHGLSCQLQPDVEQRPLLMALLKNLQASLVNATAGMAQGSELIYGLEMGSEWGEETATDFENETLLHPYLRHREPHATLLRAYQLLHEQVRQWPALRNGQVYYQRNEFAGGDPDDRVLGYVRFTDEEAVLMLHNLDPVQERAVRYDFAYLPRPVSEALVLFDTYGAFGILPADGGRTQEEREGGGFVLRVKPLQSRVLQLVF
jgi:hypothetical protein